MIIKKDKKGSEVFSIWWFIIISIISVVVCLMILRFYSNEINVSDAEVKLFSNNIESCLIDESGFVSDGFVLSGDNFNIFSECHLAENILDVKGSSFYFNVSLYDESQGLVNEVHKGQVAFEKDCTFALKGMSKDITCFSKRQEVLYYNKEGVLKNGILTILTASKNKGSRK
jgi:hypothetical protein